MAGPASFWTQTNALLRRNFTLQKRNMRTNILLISYPALFFTLSPLLQLLYDESFKNEMLKQCDPKINPSCSNLDFADPLSFTWVVLPLFPVALISLVYEKQQKLMMKMHGLGDLPYWIISYGCFLLLFSIYMLIIVIFGSLIGLKFLALNDFKVQFMFYFMYMNLQLILSFLGATFFSSVKTATVIATICVFGTGLLTRFIFESLVESDSIPKMWFMVMELYPGFSLHRGIFEFAQFAQLEGGMRWEHLKDSENGMTEVLIVMFVEWLVALFVAYRVVSPGGKDSRIQDQMDRADVNQEREKLDQLLHESSTSHTIVCDNLQKIYPGGDGNPEKLAVRGLYLAVARGECFGMLGPNGAGKTSFINMMIGLTKPTSGIAFVQGLDIRTQMDEIYASMGVCPQHDLLWETLTGREHLLFYGRLKNLKGSALTQAVKESLKSLNLFSVADKQAGEYNESMKRMLSVAISLIGDSKVVYMEEPSTGLDPASRKNLWNFVKKAKQNRTIILTTHIMEEVEFLCDQFGFFVDGNLQFMGNPKELKDRYGGSYMFTITTSLDHKEVEDMVQHLVPSAKKVYQLNRTQKFEIPKSKVRIADVLEEVLDAKSKSTDFDWDLAETNMADVFIEVSQGGKIVPARQEKEGGKIVPAHREEVKAIAESTEGGKIVPARREKEGGKIVPARREEVKAIAESTELEKKATPASRVITKGIGESSNTDKGKAPQGLQIIVAESTELEKKATPASRAITKGSGKGKAAQGLQIIVAGASDRSSSEGGLTVADFEAFMDRFENENHKAKYTSRFWKVDGDLVDFYGYSISEDCLPLLKKLRKRHDYLQNYRISLCIGNYKLRKLGEIISDMYNSRVDFLTETRLLEWKTEVEDLIKWGLDLGFILDHLRVVARRMFVFRAKAEIENLKRKIADSMNLLELLESLEETFQANADASESSNLVTNGLLE